MYSTAILQICIYWDSIIDHQYRDGVEGLVGAVIDGRGGSIYWHGQEVWYGQYERHNWNISYDSFSLEFKHLLTVSKDKENTTPVHCAVGHSHGVELDHDEPPDSQHQGVPDGHCV